MPLKGLQWSSHYTELSAYLIYPQTIYQVDNAIPIVQIRKPRLGEV